MAAIGAEGLGESHVAALAQLVISESRSFPDLASIWHDNVVAPKVTILTGFITQAQECAEVRTGDLKVHVFSIIGPIMMALLFHDVFGY